MVLRSTTFSLFTAMVVVMTLLGCSETTHRLSVAQQGEAPAVTHQSGRTGVTTLVHNQQQFQAAVSALQAGDTVVLADGEWRDAELLFKGRGTAEHPVTLKAETPGKVILSGLSNLRLAGEYLIIEGLVFKNGYSPTGEVISFRENENNLANHSRVTQVVIDQFSNPDKFNADYWVVMYGKHNRFDHNHLSGKSNAGVTMTVRLNSVASQENHHRIDHNYFGPRPILGSNGGETLRIGTSQYSLSDSFTVVEANYFEHCNGEVEIISNKSGKNQFLHNVFFESRGTLTLRHGNGNLVEGNVFLGNGKDHTGGIRVINADQTIRNNYLEGLTGTRFGGGFTVLNGVPNSSINRYHQVKHAIIENNTFINVDTINLAAGSDAERTATPVDSRFANNLLVNSDGRDPFKIFDDVAGITFANNKASQPPPAAIASGFTTERVSLVRAANGLLQSATASALNIGATPSLPVISRDQTGVSWYPKAMPQTAFDSGKTLRLSTAAQLMETIANVAPGTIILLEPGTYDINKQLQVRTVVTVKAAQPRSVTLFAMRSLMFEIEDGGSLKLDGLDISGKKAPDNAGNVVIRNTKIPTLHNYRLHIHNSHITDLNVNHSAHVFDAGYRSLADDIQISDSLFENITGDVLRLDKEQDDLGIYNAEYVTISNTTFRHIEGAVAKLYRGGTDESTFGPHFSLVDSVIDQVGGGKRNRSHSALYLLGVQQTLIQGNQFKQSKEVTIDHTVGEPITRILHNRFIQSPMPVVTETFAKGPSTAVWQDNTSE
jgi:poly(beta-D-mannuronate) lyase